MPNVPFSYGNSNYSQHPYARRQRSQAYPSWNAQGPQGSMGVQGWNGGPGSYGSFGNPGGQSSGINNRQFWNQGSSTPSQGWTQTGPQQWSRQQFSGIGGAASQSHGHVTNDPQVAGVSPPTVNIGNLLEYDRNNQEQDRQRQLGLGQAYLGSNLNSANMLEALAQQERTRNQGYEQQYQQMADQGLDGMADAQKQMQSAVGDFEKYIQTADKGFAEEASARASAMDQNVQLQRQQRMYQFSAMGLGPEQRMMAEQEMDRMSGPEKQAMLTDLSTQNRALQDSRRQTLASLQSNAAQFTQSSGAANSQYRTQMRELARSSGEMAANAAMQMNLQASALRSNGYQFMAQLAAQNPAISMASMFLFGDQLMNQTGVGGQRFASQFMGS